MQIFHISFHRIYFSFSEKKKKYNKDVVYLFYVKFTNLVVTDEYLMDFYYCTASIMGKNKQASTAVSVRIWSSNYYIP